MDEKFTLPADLVEVMGVVAEVNKKLNRLQATEELRLKEEGYSADDARELTVSLVTASNHLSDTIVALAKYSSVLIEDAMFNN